MTDDVTLCNACKALAVTWNDEAGSDVCQQCGTIYPSMNNLQTLRAEEFEGHSLLQNMVLRVPSSGHVLGGQGDRLHQNLVSGITTHSLGANLINLREIIAK